MGGREEEAGRVGMRVGKVGDEGEERGWGWEEGMV